MSVFIREFEKNGQATLTVIDMANVNGEQVAVTNKDPDVFQEISAKVFDMSQEGATFEEIKEFIELAQGGRSVEETIQLRKELGIEILPDGAISLLEGKVVLPKECAKTFRQVNSLEQGKRLIKFAELLMQNPHEHARLSLIEWLVANPCLTIMDNGHIRGYRGNDKNLMSHHGGYGIITRPGCEPEEVNGKHDNRPGNIIEFPREMADHNPNHHCSVGIHVGTKEYAHGWGDTWVTVDFSPADVISFPQDGTDYKIRVTKIKVLEQVDEAYMLNYEEA